MRENIGLFKAQRINSVEWVTGLLTIMWGQYHIINPSDENTAYPIKTETLCEFTGLTDKNGKMIWENDIVKWDLENKKIHKASVEYYLGGFVYKQVPQGFIQDYPPHPMFIIDESKVEVIGNKFEEVDSD